MLKPEQVPNEVVNALWRDGYDFGDGMPSQRMQIIRDAIAAAINAWPGMQLSCLTVEVSGRKILLPLPATQEPSDE